VTRRFSLLTVVWIIAVLAVVLGGPGNEPRVMAQARDTLVVGGSESIGTLDPHATLSQSDYNVIAHVMDTLLEWDENYKLVPALATSFRAVNDKTWEFALRRDVRFSNGEPFNAETVKFNIDRILTEKPRIIAGGLDVIERAEAVNEHTVRIVTKQPYPAIPRQAATIFMVPKGYVTSRGQAFVAQNPVGTGPWRFVRWQKGSEVVLEARTGSWRGTPKIRRLVFRELPETATRISALISGEVDIIQQVPPADIARIERGRNLKVASVPSARGMYLGFNAKVKPWDDKRVRLALNYAIDKETLVRTILMGRAKILNGQVVTPEYFGYDPTLKPYPFDLARARQLLAEAGVTSASATLDYPPGRYLLVDDVVQFLIAQLAQVGITAKANPMDFATFVSRFTTSRLNELFFYGFAAPTLEADRILGFYESTNRYSYINNPDFDRLLNRARTTVNDAQRDALYHRASWLLRSDPPVVFMYQQPLITGMSARVKGWSPTVDESIYLHKASLE